jgi:hypothetical protein
MANKDNLIKLVAQKLGPDKLQQMVDQAAQALGNDPDVTPEVIDKIIQMFEYVAEHPEEYQSVIQQAIQTGALDEGDLPPTFDPTIIAVILLAFYGLRDKLGAQQPSPSQMAMPMQDAQMPQMAMGGLHQAGQRLQNAGRGGDTILAHITPQEANLLERRGGTGSINPATGLPEYKFGKFLKKAFKAVLPIALNFVPVVGPYLAIAAGAALNAKQGIKGMIIGGLGAGLAPGGAFSGLTNSIGSFANSAIGNFGGLSNQVLGSGILGAGSAAIQGKNPIIGGLTAGALANYAPQIVDKYGSMLPTDVAANMATGAQAAANTGQGLKGIATSAGTSGLATLANNALGGDSVVNNTETPLPTPNPEEGMYNSATGKFDLGSESGMATYGDGQIGNTLDIPANAGGYAPGLAPVVAAPAPTTTGALSQVAATGTPSTGFSMGDIAKIGILGALIGGKTPQQANDAIQQDPTLTAQQKEGMLRQLTNYKFDPGMTVFPQQGTSEWDRLMGQINQGVEQTYAKPTFTEEPALARGGRTRRKPQGALSQVSRLSLGAGDGRSDSIEARLSDGEYVIDAETVALLGNGSTKAGAAMLDQMRQQIRQQKGRALAKGKFSPDAKSPLAYMKGGLR